MTVAMPKCLLLLLLLPALAHARIALTESDREQVKGAPRQTQVSADMRKALPLGQHEQPTTAPPQQLLEQDDIFKADFVCPATPVDNLLAKGRGKWVGEGAAKRYVSTTEHLVLKDFDCLEWRKCRDFAELVVCFGRYFRIVRVDSMHEFEHGGRRTTNFPAGFFAKLVKQLTRMDPVYVCETVLFQFGSQEPWPVFGQVGLRPRRRATDPNAEMQFEELDADGIKYTLNTGHEDVHEEQFNQTYFLRIHARPPDLKLRRMATLEIHKESQKEHQARHAHEGGGQTAEQEHEGTMAEQHLTGTEWGEKEQSTEVSAERHGHETSAEESAEVEAEESGEGEGEGGDEHADEVRRIREQMEQLEAKMRRAKSGGRAQKGEAEEEDEREKHLTQKLQKTKRKLDEHKKSKQAEKAVPQKGKAVKSEVQKRMHKSEPNSKGTKGSKQPSGPKTTSKKSPPRQPEGEDVHQHYHDNDDDEIETVHGVRKETAGEEQEEKGQPKQFDPGHCVRDETKEHNLALYREKAEKMAGHYRLRNVSWTEYMNFPMVVNREKVDYHLVEGGTLHIEKEIVGNGHLQVDWTVNGRSMDGQGDAHRHISVKKPQQKAKMDKRGDEGEQWKPGKSGKTTLSIAHALASDAGRIILALKNDWGTDCVELKVHVMKKQPASSHPKAISRAKKTVPSTSKKKHGN